MRFDEMIDQNIETDITRPCASDCVLACSHAIMRSNNQHLPILALVRLLGLHVLALTLAVLMIMLCSTWGLLPHLIISGTDTRLCNALSCLCLVRCTHKTLSKEKLYEPANQCALQVKQSSDNVHLLKTGMKAKSLEMLSNLKWLASEIENACFHIESIPGGTFRGRVRY